MWEWITACRPVFDIENEDNEKRNEDESEGEHEEQSDDRYTCSTEETCKCMKPAELSPEWTWVFTKDGYKSYELWLNEQLKRDQDEWGLYICNDFSGYGVLEVMENQVSRMLGNITTIGQSMNADRALAAHEIQPRVQEEITKRHDHLANNRRNGTLLEWRPDAVGQYVSRIAIHQRS